MNSSGNKPPASVPAKGNYLLLDLSRNSGYFGIPLNTPQVFPANTLSTMRFLTVVSKEAPNSLESLSRCLFKRYWTDNLDVIQNDSIMAACSSVGIERSLAEQWIQLSTSVPIKEELKKNTEEAASLGAFGAPTFFISEVGSSVPPEMFFGSDRFENTKIFIKKTILYIVLIYSINQPI